MSVNAHCGNDCDSYCNYVGYRGEQAKAVQMWMRIGMELELELMALALAALHEA